ncbi:unnamed protein product, partial [Cuscuta europaea]
MLEWYEPEVCKFSIALPVDAFHYPQNSEFGTIIDRKDLAELLEGDSVDMCIIQSFALFHWILIVICPPVNKGYIFNSIPSFSNIIIQKDLALAYRVASARNGDGKPITWHNVKCARQNGNTECGYYTMRYIWEVISYVDSFDIGKDWYSRTEAYSEDEFNNIRNIW